jgi:hypothetical protein
LDNRFPSFLFHFPIVLMLFFEYIRHRSRVYRKYIALEIHTPEGLSQRYPLRGILHILGRDMHSMADFPLLL